MKLRALLVEDDPSDADLMLVALEVVFDPVEHRRVDNAAGLRAALAEPSWDVVIADHRLPSFSSTAALQMVREAGLDLPFIIVSGTIGEEAAVEAMRAGASDYLLKANLARLAPLVQRELREADDRRARRTAEQALRLSEEKYRTIVEASSDGICTVDAQLNVMFVNRRLAALLGCEAIDVVGRPLTDLLDDEGASAGLPSAEHGRAWLRAEHDLKLRRRDGKPTWVHTTPTLLRDGDGHEVGALMLIRDITEAKNMMAQLMVSDRMASVGTLAAGVAHEINNPLAVVVANLDQVAGLVAQVAVARRSLDPGDIRLAVDGFLHEIDEPLHDARVAADRVRTISRDLKTFSRGEEERRGPVDVRAVLDISLRMAGNEIRHRARLVRDFGEVPAVQANEARLGQVFLNLIVNAAQAIPEGKADEHRIVVRASHQDDWVIVDVSDDGVGISAEDLGRIFDPFFTTKPIGVGTGLGLAISHRIITGLGGTISVDSQVGRGTTFRVRLPAAVAPRTAAPATAPEPKPARRGRVLVVDDEEAIGRTLTRMLSRAHDVAAVTSARAALERCRAGERFDVILCDLMMPDMTGMELYAELEQVAPDQAARMVFATGGAFTPRARQFLETVRNPRVDKPFDAAQVRALVASLIQ